MIYELRIYHMCPGKMEAISNRFRDVTLPLFTRHNIVVDRFWTDAEGKETLYYVCAFPSTEAMAAAWDAFRADPAWIESKAKSEENGAIVEYVESFIMQDAPFFQKL